MSFQESYEAISTKKFRIHRFYTSREVAVFAHFYSASFISICFLSFFERFLMFKIGMNSYI